MPATPVNANSLQIGAGWLYIAAVGSTEPVDTTTAWAGAWSKLGYTKEGHVFTSETKRDGIYVAEAVDPIRYENTEVSEKIEFSAAEDTATNLKRAIGQGTLSIGATVTTFDPGDRAITRPDEYALGWESFALDERLIIRRAVQTGAVGIARKKAPDYTVLPMAFMLLKPSSGSTWIHLYLNARG